MENKQPINVGLFQLQVSLPNERGISTHWVAPGGIWIEDYMEAMKVAEKINARIKR